MWIKEPGEINDRLVFLGTQKNNLYLVKGDRYMLIGGGGQWIVPELARQIRDYQIDMDRVHYLFVGHSHYDHCGAVPYLRKRYPHIKILASQGAVKLFGMEKAVKNMRTFSRQVMENLGYPMEFDGISLELDGVTVDRGLKDGEQIDLGNDLCFNVYETPGHSRCAMTAYAPRQKWLFPSDSLCIPVDDADEFVSTASESFVTYLDSLKKLEKLDVHLCAWEHHGVMTDGDAHDIIKRGIRFSLDYRRRILNLLEETGDSEQVAHWATKNWLDRTGFDFLPYDIMLYISREVVENAVEEKIEESKYL
jgi:glyoxylase-like metal-dependent hydrolase (beta-lactamase superfamily II)